MALKLGRFLISVFKSKYIAVLVVSMFPLIELKGAIPIGMSQAFSMGLWETAGIAYLGSTVISLLEFFLLVPVFNLLKKIKFFKSFVEKVENVFIEKGKKLAQKAQGSAEDQARRIMRWGLFIFVAVPFPVTGVWTGTAIAVFLNMQFKDALPPIALGNLVAGAVITLLTFFFQAYVDIIIYALFIIAIIMFVLMLVKVFKSKKAE